MGMKRTSTISLDGRELTTRKEKKYDDKKKEIVNSKSFETISKRLARNEGEVM